MRNETNAHAAHNYHFFLSAQAVPHIMGNKTTKDALNQIVDDSAKHVQIQPEMYAPVSFPCCV